ncbi:MAG: hypothetical protein EOO45_10750 [Flavobacterium sp.]|nr:MAG: hypothetical protein EOO45_10750 [Flavobacterium sp.]
MKAKWFFTIFLLVVASSGAFAQGANQKCESSFKTFENNVKAGDLNDADNLLPDLLKLCPKVSEKVYEYGQLVLEHKVRTASSSEDEKKSVNDLLDLYSVYEKNFPANNNAITLKRARLQWKYKLAPEQDVYKALSSAFAKNRQAFADYESIEIYFNLFLKDYEANKKLTQEEFLEAYGAISGQVIAAKNAIAQKEAELRQKKETTPLSEDEARFLEGAEQASESLTAVGENVYKQSSKYLSCEMLEAYYGKNYSENKTNVAWLNGLVEVMMSSRCYNSPIMQQSALDAHVLRPTAQSAYTLGNIAMRNRDSKKAIGYYEESAGLEKNIQKKSELYYEIASIFRNSDKAEAKKYALKSAELNPKYGRPYLLLAEMYSSVTKECTLTDFEKKAVYWLAIDASQKAAVAEKKYQPTATAMIKNFDARKPGKQDVKDAKLKKGAKVAIGCWINETVTVPNI